MAHDVQKFELAAVQAGMWRITAYKKEAYDLQLPSAVGSKWTLH